MTASPQDVQSTMQQLDSLLQEVDRIADPAARQTMAGIIQGMMDFHGAALRSMMDRLAQAGDSGRALIDDLARDELAASLLLLYDLHPQDMATRVEAALANVRPYLASHGGNVELLGIDDGVVRLAMQGSCHGCPSSAATLKTTVEQAIYDMAPDAADIRVEGALEEKPHAPAGFVPVEELTARNSRKPLEGVNS